MEVLVIPLVIVIMGENMDDTALTLLIVLIRSMLGLEKGMEVLVTPLVIVIMGENMDDSVVTVWVGVISLEVIMISLPIQH